ncbi:hypothetical protein DOY81_009389 [Sarcophaga bullata]|nr:hypothetical protein DOY81_009389 [Sarcophaga bullata]
MQMPAVLLEQFPNILPFPHKNASSAATGKSQESSRAKRLPPSGCDEHGCFIPAAEHSLPPIVIAKDESGVIMIIRM